MSEGLPPGHRVKKRGEFRRIQGRGRKVHTRHLLLLVHPSLRGAEHPRLGVTVTRKIGNAVARNRVRRRLREIFRRHRDLFPPASDVVVIVKRGAPDLSYDELLAEVRRAQRALRRAARAAAEASSEAEARERLEPPSGSVAAPEGSR